MKPKNFVKWSLFFFYMPFAGTIIFPAQAQVVTYTLFDIVSTPPDSTGNYEKAVGHFTSTSRLSYFLGTDTAAYIFDPTTGVSIVVATDGRHYERAKAYKAKPEDRYDSIVASAGNGNGQLVAYWNPANWNGGNAKAAWDRFVIYGGSGCHDLDIEDFDGDGKPDIACSSSYNYGNAPAFIMYQNTYNDWTGPIYAVKAGDGIAAVAVNGVNGRARTNLVGCEGATLYWYQNSGRRPGWPREVIGDCNQGTSLATLNVGDEISFLRFRTRTSRTSGRAASHISIPVPPRIPPRGPNT